MTEWSYASGKAYGDPFNEVQLDVLFTDPDGDEQLVPAFWAGEQNWSVRYASPKVGRHEYRTVCSDAANDDLHGREGVLEVSPYEGENPLLRHGPIKVAEDRRHFEHADGAPFLWLGDTWWMGLCKRLRWPDDFRTLMADRVAKGFSVIQIVAGLYPDMPYLDERGANEAGFPWEEGYTGINPAYYDMADLRIAALVDAGLMPCILACWGYFMMWMGVERMKQHWRYLVARYGAYPVVWCLAGEGSMPYYLSETREQDVAAQRKGWTELARYVHEIDPWSHLVTIHPSRSARDVVEDPSVLDFDMLQTGHGDRQSAPNTVNLVRQSYESAPTMPVINGEVCYEGIIEASREEIQRFMFWSCILSGACGHTYGANGIWQVNEEGKPYGPSPHGSSWGDRPWTEAYRLPGSGQLGLAKQFLERYEWWRLESHPEWVAPHWTEDNYWQPYAAGIPGELIVIFMPTREPPCVKQLDPQKQYRACYWNPSDATEVDLGVIKSDGNGDWQAPKPPIFRDWVLVVEVLEGA
jgi:hypothetical protein